LWKRRKGGLKERGQAWAANVFDPKNAFSSRFELSFLEIPAFNQWEKPIFSGSEKLPKGAFPRCPQEGKARL
jgi:hypothetical protein